MEKNVIDLMDGFNSEKIQKELQEKFFKQKEIKTEKQVDPMQMGLKLMSNPKLLKKILIVFGFFFLVGIITTAYFTTISLSGLTTFAKKYYDYNIPAWLVVTAYLVVTLRRSILKLIGSGFIKIKNSIANLLQKIKTKKQPIENPNTTSTFTKYPEESTITPL